MHDYPNDIENQLPHHDMILVEGGEYEMGSEDAEAYDWEKPVHRVRVSGFRIGKFPVTQALWKAVMETEDTPSFFRGDDRPVESVSWEEVLAFIRKLNERTGRNTYRLPTEAEWEYAARGGKFRKERNYNYAGSNKLKEVGWFKDTSHKETKAVGLKYPNDLGIYDMSGNVWEACSDWFDFGQYYQDCKKKGLVENPTGPVSGFDRVARGGGWIDSPRGCRVSYRGRWLFDRGGYLGFRLVLAPSLKNAL